jgi:hypothetical protein
VINNQLRDNIQKSINRLDTILQSEGAGEFLFFPTFKGEKKQLICEQENWFGFFVLRNGFRGLLTSINHLATVQIIRFQALYGPTIAAAYTASFLLLDAFLAFNGIIIVDLPPEYNKRKIILKPLVVGKLSKKRGWIFEGMKRNHESRWLQLHQIIGSRKGNVPIFFHRLFAYFFREEYKKKRPLIEILNNKSVDNNIFIGEKWQLHERVTDFLKRIALSRHESIYGSFGSDAYVYETLVNRDTFSTSGLNEKAAQFMLFAQDLAIYVANNIKETISTLQMSDSIRKLLFLCISIPYFDDPKIKFLQPIELQNLVKFFIDFLLR